MRAPAVARHVYTSLYSCCSRHSRACASLDILLRYQCQQLYWRCAAILAVKGMPEAVSRCGTICSLLHNTSLHSRQTHSGSKIPGSLMMHTKHKACHRQESCSDSLTNFVSSCKQRLRNSRTAAAFDAPDQEPNTPKYCDQDVPITCGGGHKCAYVCV